MELYTLHPSNTDNKHSSFDTYLGHNQAQFFPNNKQLLTFNNNDVCVRIYNIQTHKVITTFASKYVETSDIHPLGTILITGDYKGEMHVWDCTKMKLIYSNPKHHTISISKATFISKSNMVVASSSFDGVFSVFDFGSNKIIHSIIMTEYGLESFAYSQSNNTFAIPCRKDIKLWDLRYPKQPFSILEGHKSWVKYCKFHPTQQNILITSGDDHDNMIWKWNIQTEEGECLYMGNCICNLNSISFFRDSSQVIYSNGCNIHVIQNNKDHDRNDMKLQIPEYIKSIDISDSGKYMAVGCYRRKIKIFDITKWNLRQRHD